MNDYWAALAGFGGVVIIFLIAWAVTEVTNRWRS
jgi:hypothetical protein